jgi:hypothetical protein
MSDDPNLRMRPPSILDRLFAGGSIAAFAVLMSSVGEAVYLYLR